MYETRMEGFENISSRPSAHCHEKQKTAFENSWIVKAVVVELLLVLNFQIFLFFFFVLQVCACEAFLIFYILLASVKIQKVYQNASAT